MEFDVGLRATLDNLWSGLDDTLGINNALLVHAKHNMRIFYHITTNTCPTTKVVRCDNFYSVAFWFVTGWNLITERVGALCSTHDSHAAIMLTVQICKSGLASRNVSSKWRPTHSVANLTICLLTLSPTATIACTVCQRWRITMKHCLPEGQPMNSNVDHRISG